MDGEERRARAAAKRARLREKAERLAAQLRGLRATRHLTQGELGARSGVARQLISLLEHARRPRPEPETVEKLARALGVTADQLRGREPLPAPEEAPAPAAPVPTEAQALEAALGGRPLDYATALGFLPVLPPGTTIIQTRHPDGSVTVYLHIPGPRNRPATDEGSA